MLVDDREVLATRDALPGPLWEGKVDISMRAMRLVSCDNVLHDLCISHGGSVLEASVTAPAIGACSHGLEQGYLAVLLGAMVGQVHVVHDVGAIICHLQHATGAQLVVRVPKQGSQAFDDVSAGAVRGEEHGAVLGATPPHEQQGKGGLVVNRGPAGAQLLQQLLAQCRAGANDVGRARVGDDNGLALGQLHLHAGAQVVGNGGDQLLVAPRQLGGGANVQSLHLQSSVTARVCQCLDAANVVTVAVADKQVVQPAKATNRP